MAPGVKINLVSKTFLDRMTTVEKIRFILDEVEAGKVLVLERGLTALEEARLIEVTMSEIEVDGFKGIEMQSYRADRQNADSRWKKFLNKTPRVHRPGLVVIGPANMIKTVSRDSQSIEAILYAEQGLVVAEA